MLLEDAKEASHEDAEMAAWAGAAAAGAAGNANKDSAVYLHFARLEKLRCGLDKLNESMLQLIEKTIAVSAKAHEAEAAYQQTPAKAAASASSSSSSSSSKSPLASLETPAVPVPADLQMLRDKLRRLRHAKTTLAGRISEMEKTINAMAKLKDPAPSSSALGSR